MPLTWLSCLSLSILLSILQVLKKGPVCRKKRKRGEVHKVFL